MSHIYSEAFLNAEKALNELEHSFVEGNDGSGVELIILASLARASAEAVRNIDRKREIKEIGLVYTNQPTVQSLIDELSPKVDPRAMKEARNLLEYFINKTEDV